MYYYYFSFSFCLIFVCSAFQFSSLRLASLRFVFSESSRFLFTVSSLSHLGYVYVVSRYHHGMIGDKLVRGNETIKSVNAAIYVYTYICI